MVLNALFPVLALMVVGAVLKRINFLNGTFFSASDKLVYYVLFPVLLFWKIGAAPLDFSSGIGFLAAVLCTTATLFVFSLLAIRFFHIPPFKAGSFVQSCFRFNTYIGMAVVINLFGEKGVQLFGILIGMVIPMVNIFCVSALIWFSGESDDLFAKLGATLKSLVRNPLIIGCLSGLVYASFMGGYPAYIDNTFQLLSTTTLPLALLSIGGALTFSTVRNNFALASLGAFAKLVVLPLVGMFFLFVFRVEGLAWQVSLVFFSLPASSAIYVLSGQLNSDTELASASIVLSTCAAFVPLSIAIFMVTP